MAWGLYYIQEGLKTLQHQQRMANPLSTAFVLPLMLRESAMAIKRSLSLTSF